MNKKILISLSVIAAVAALAIGGTVAYFSDTETSAGNTFTAGSIDLKIDLDRDGVHVWDLKDLVAEADKFFNYTDVKPGDDGELTVSAHVYNNPAWGCFYVDPNVDSDVTCTEPELRPVDPDCLVVGPATTNGELDDYLIFRIWKDNGNNIWETGEPFMTYCGHTGLPGPEWCYLNDINPAGEVWPLGKMEGSTTYYFGVEWKLPSATGNIVQSDSWGSDVSFYVEQFKNNPGFVCPHTP